MNSIKNLLVNQIFKSVLIIFLSTIFLLNIAFYLFSNDQYQNEIDRQYNALYNMTAHLSTEENLETLEVYLEHYTHINEVIIHFTNQDGLSVFSNDTDQTLQNFEEVYYEEVLVGYLAVNFETSVLGKDILNGFIGLNLISITLFALGMSLLFKFLKRESSIIKNDLSYIGVENENFRFREISQIHQQLMISHEQKEKQRIIYESHIKSLAHDIKTPLSVIQIYVDSFISERLSPTKENLLDVQEESKKISDLIPKFIELDYTELPYMQDISLFIEKYIYKYKEIFDSKHIRIESHLEPLKLNISDQDIKRLIEHLTFNAFYYSNDHSIINISVQNEQRILIIEDEGMGMTNETIDLISQGPYRSKEAKIINEKGSGIGFQTIKDIVKRLGANIHVESVVGKGTTISIRF